MLNRQERLLGHNKANVTKIVSQKPSNSEGVDGDIAVGNTANGSSLFAKIKNVWYEFVSEESIESDTFVSTSSYLHGATVVKDGNFIPLGGLSNAPAGDLSESFQGYTTYFLPHKARVLSLFIRSEIVLGNVQLELFSIGGGASLLVGIGENTHRIETASTVSCPVANTMYTIPFSGNYKLDAHSNIAIRINGANLEIDPDDDGAHITYVLILDLDVPV